jgi:electron transfer flavoprotein beta subunit
MPTVIACYKWVIDEADIKTNADLSIDCSKAKWKISDYDKNAIEAAVQAARAIGGKAVTLSFGSAQAKASLKDALSRGPEEAYWVNSPLAESADGFVTAKVLAAAIAGCSDVQLVICAEGSSDTYARQTAPRIGAALDWPVITSITKISLDGNVLTADRSLGNSRETVQITLPAVISVLPETNPAPIPGLKAIIAAGKKPVTELDAAQLGVANLEPKVRTQSFKAYVMNRKKILLSEGDAAAQVKELVTQLKKEGVL